MPLQKQTTSKGMSSQALHLSDTAATALRFRKSYFFFSISS